MSSTEVPAPQEWEYIPDAVTIYGVKLNNLVDPETNDELLFALLSFDVSQEGFKVQISAIEKDEPLEQDDVAIVLAYGYSYEGHCYRFSRTRVLIFSTTESRNGRGEEARGCGFDTGGEGQPRGGYRMWRLRSLDQVIELSPSLDTVQKLVLEASLPGKRAPQTYNDDMQLAHRGGRLTRTGGP